MELNISDIPPSICLNMIVKNESHIIKETLEMLCNKINFSYWVICDTGSTDNTQKYIVDFFKSKDIPGELYNHPWKNFAHNRTLALESAFNKTDLLFVFDADDEIHGNIKMPTKLDSDGYLLNFGTSAGISYQRVLLVNNRIKWNYQCVIHEYINCLKPNAKITSIDGDYYIVSGRRGSRNSDPEKYLKDAKILEEAYDEAKKFNDKLYIRYGFYCANSYKDAGISEEAIKWYKITLNNENWTQEKYMCCLNLYHEYTKIGEKEKAFYYLIESFKYDTERMECIYHLVHHYLITGFDKLGYAYYTLVRDFYENKYLQSNVDGKLFVENDKANFYLPYYMILVADKVKDIFPEAKNSIINMFKIAFTKKHPITEEFFIGNLLYNLQFFIDSCIDNFYGFIELLQNYINFIEQDMKMDLSKHQFLKNFEKYGIKFKCFKIVETTFSIEDCKQCKNILFYSGFANLPWNYTYSIHNALGGSETALANLANSFPSDFKIYIGGFVAEETIANITYVSLDNLKILVKTIPFHTVIVSRYVAFYEMFSETSFYQSFIWGHDCALYSYGCNQDVNYILNKWNSKINGCICQTEWHKNLFANQYPQLKNKIFTINNGILVEKFIYNPIKITNRFIYTSCAERGLDRLLVLWPQIIEKLPGAELFIASYNHFPHNDFEIRLNNIIKTYNSIKHVGTLNRDELYELMSSAEFWLYPTNFNETSCITSMEMLMSEVICLYYPVAGLINTLGEYGIKIQSDNEINTILSLSTKQKNDIRKKGKEYALTCSWNNRAQEWIKQCKIQDINKTWIFYCSTDFNQKPIKQYIENLNILFTDYNILLSCDKQYILNINPVKITFIYEIFDDNILTQLPNCHFSYLNTEPLNIPIRLKSVLDILRKYKFNYYDYSKSNIKLLTENNVNTDTSIYLPYVCNNDELITLTKLNKDTNKIYDFGLIVGAGGDVTERRKPIVEFLIKNEFSVNIISGWCIKRDIELAKCKIILNLHGFFTIPSNIFEHIRCDRLLMAGFKILSEQSLYLDSDFKNKFPNLTLIKYTDFFDYDIISKIVLDDNTNIILDISKKEPLLLDENKIKIIDCFIFYNELELLNYRLNILNDVVDYFVLVESTNTHSGKDKELYFKNNIKRFSKFKNKIIHVIVDDFPYTKNININNNEQWINEKFQRNCITRGLEKLKLNNNDIITICDLDEIPDPTVLLQLKNNNQDIEIKIIELDFYYYNLNSKRREKWYHTKILSYNKFKELNTTCDNIRFINAPVINKAGWHLSYFGDAEFIKNKLVNFAHQEYNNEQYTNIETVQEKIYNCTDLFGRLNNDMDYIEIEYNNYLPPMYDIYLRNFYKFNKTIIGKNYCFIHSCCIEEGQTERLDYLINKLIDSNCINILSKIYIINIGFPLGDNYIQNLNINKRYQDKFEITNYSSNIKLQEAPTINNMISFSKLQPNDNILYIHTKGIRHNFNDTKMMDWINMMLYFLLFKYNTCILFLNSDYSSVGCNYLSVPFKHYSGNFWWARTNHLAKLNYIDVNNNPRDIVEFHLFSIDHYNFEIHNSNINHYMYNYPEEKYKPNKKNLEKISIKYGTIDYNIDITSIVFSYCVNDNIIKIRSGYYYRDSMFGDPIIGTHKFIIVQIDTKLYMFDEYQDVDINLTSLNTFGSSITYHNIKYKLSACIMLKNETENLNDWLEHYIKQGVEHFFILSNNSSDNITEFIKNSSYNNMISLLIDNRDLNIYNNTVEHRQILCDNFYQIVKATSEWSILVDIDEFMSGKNGYTISSFIDTIQPNIGCVYVYWNIFKPTFDSDGNITEKFERNKNNKRINLDSLKELPFEINFASKFGKSLFRTSMLNDNIKLWIHKVQTNGQIITNYGNISDYKYDNDDDILWSEDNYTKLDIILSHYVIRHKKDYERKMSQLENTHRSLFIKGVLDIISLEDKYFIEDHTN